MQRALPFWKSWLYAGNANHAVALLPVGCCVLADRYAYLAQVRAAQ